MSAHSPEKPAAPAAPSAADAASKAYQPSAIEPVITRKWAESGAFHPDPQRVLRGEAKPYSIVIPPPNVTGALHLGHALNNTLQDILTRAHRMMGFETLWMPGTDHAGIATQAVVEKRLLKEEGKRRKDFTREQFVARVQEWKDEYEARITGQLRAMGCSCDFDRQRFTMDDICARAVREAFFILFRDGLIYRGKWLVNWDPALQTAVADDECYDEEVDSNFWYMRYPLETPVKLPSGETIDHVTVATTRPETYLGDSGVAMNPSDPRAAALNGKHVVLPLVGRRIPIVLDDYVVLPAAMAKTEEARNDPKAAFATGFLKVTPAHDKNDEQIGLRHKLAAINMMSPDGRVSDKHGWSDVGQAGEFVGKTMAEARKAVAAKFKELGLLEEVRPYRQTISHSDRSKAVIEPYLSDQWYVRVTDDRLSGAANRALVPEQRSAGSLGSIASGGTGVPPVRSSNDEYDRLGPVSPNLMMQHRNLPHWEAGGSTYFVTFRVAKGTLSDSERQVVLDAARHWHGQKIELHAAVVMPDHVHMLFSPFLSGERQWHSISEVLHSVKSFSAHQINKSRGTSGPLWQDESFDRIVRSGHEFAEKMSYIADNPRRAGLAKTWAEYPFTVLSEHARAGRLEFTDRIRDPKHRRDACATGGNEDATDGTMTFHPPRYAKTFEQWHDNIRDWCISRQLWWGHRIPVWHRKLVVRAGVRDYAPGLSVGNVRHAVSREHPAFASSGYVVRSSTSDVLTPSELSDFYEAKLDGEYDIFLCLLDPTQIEYFEHRGFTQDPDVLDTWFSSALWPLSTLGWPEPAQSPQTDGLLGAFNPTSVLSTAREIITLWVSRMTMMNRYLLGAGGGRGPVPFRDVFIHAVVQDGEGRKMSKSLGNGVDPLDIIESHGADAMRFTLCQMTTQTQDVRMPVVREAKSGKNTSPKFDLGRNFCNKLWNASRFAIGMLPKVDGARPHAERGGTPSPIDPRSLSLIDRWMLSRLAATTANVDTLLKNYEFSDYAEAMYRLLWWDVCDWYLEAVKPTIAGSPAQQAVLAHALETVVRLLHPITPFVTEAVWEQLRSVETPPIAGFTLGSSRTGLLCTAGWPRIDAGVIDAEAEKTFEALRELISAIRNARSEHQVPPKRRITLHASPAALKLMALSPGLVETLAGVEKVD
ncbi:MAG: class I tRNA ligase family protein, partial [Phycisphaerales bacterium]|nr:class I tRNA ligase family protein [Phycisphaerales bacterium]